jgi:signal transduction histidine kinase
MDGGAVQPEVLDLKPLAQEVVTIYNPIAHEKAISITFTAGVGTAFADPEMVKTIIRNLLANAIKFTPSNGTVDVSTKTIDNMCQITVQDTGVGMTAEQVTSVFAIDQKTSTTGTAGEIGTGLGLPLCQEMLERNGGCIWIESTPGKGSQFHVTLPSGY